MSSDVLLSVIMPMYNAEAFVAAAVHSVLQQSFSDFEFLIVDDGSTDGSAAIVAEIAKTDQRIILLRQENQGIVVSLNRMIAQARGSLIARMDADDICLPDRFAKQIDYLLANPDVGAVGTQFIEIDEHNQPLDSSFRHPVGKEAVLAQMQYRMAIGNPTAMFRASALRAAGVYRIPFRYCEDYDLFLRLSRISALDNLPEILFQYRRSPGQMSIANNSKQTLQSVMALFAHREVLAGRIDPFADVAELPRLESLDKFIGRTGVADQLRRAIVDELRFSSNVLSGPEFALFRHQARHSAGFSGDWRTVLRCVRFGLYQNAVVLLADLVRGRLNARAL